MRRILPIILLLAAVPLAARAAECTCRADGGTEASLVSEQMDRRPWGQALSSQNVSNRTTS